MWCLYKLQSLVDEEKYLRHIDNKETARKVNEFDKNLAIEKKCIVLQQDLQAVKVCPYLKESGVYYKRKLCIYDFFIIYEIASRKTALVFWDAIGLASISFRKLLNRLFGRSCLWKSPNNNMELWLYIPE